LKKLLIIFTVLLAVTTGVTGVSAFGSAGPLGPFPLQGEYDEITPRPLPEGAQMFDRYLAIGGDASMGAQGESVDETRQRWSFPKRIAEQVGTPFNQAVVSFPGYFFNMEDVAKGNIRWHQYYSHLTTGFRKLSNVDQDTLHNFSIAGSTVFTALKASGFNGGFYELVLGASGRPMVRQALDRTPTFISVYFGINDLMSAIEQCDIGELNDVIPDYATLFESIKLNEKKNGGSIQGVLVGNIPDITSMPFLVEDLTPGAPEGSLKAFYSAETDSSTRLTPKDMAVIQEARKEINKFIEVSAEQNGWALVDMDKVFSDAKANGRYLLKPGWEPSEIKFNARYLGGLFCLDGVNPSITGSAVIANYCIEAINHTYGTSISNVDEFETRRSDTLYLKPYDPRPFLHRGVFGKLKFYYDNINL